MKVAFEILIGELSAGAAEKLKGELADAVAGHGLTPTVSTYTPPSDSLAALDAVTPQTLETAVNTYNRPAAQIRCYTA